MILLLLLACHPRGSESVVGDTCEPGEVREADGAGTDTGVVADCVSCHADIGASWALGGNHALLFDCRDCHTLSADEGAGHASKPDCAACHSEQAHPPGETCVTCHDPHGTLNLYLVRDDLGAFTEATGSGLAPGDGTGVCEGCHTSTTYYNAAGDGPAHETGWCATCHDHQAGMQGP